MNELKSGQDLNGLLAVVSKKLGVPPEQLRKELESGKFDSALRNLSSADAQKFQQAIRNPKLVEKLMSAPQAKALYEKLTGGTQ
ncbi:MAG: hypothetical protein E7502_04105 [Ruminococcus sp.]|jgi:hypothetical protein|nr:hypothetical protein [Ruminococcus sp.]